MSWRRFMTLMAGLSAESRFIADLAHRQPVEKVISSDADIDAFVASYGV